jgi:carbon-monoxide dehydrogenase medium subunit
LLRPFRYRKPFTIEETLKGLLEYGDRAKVVAGGTDLMVQMKQGLLSPQILFDISRIGELRKIEERDDGVYIGAAATMAEIGAWFNSRAGYRALLDGVNSVGSRQVRNVATIGGNLCNAVPSADTAPPLIALQAELQLVGAGGGSRRIGAEQFFRGPRETILATGELLTGIILPPLNPRQRSRYLKLGPRNGMDLAIVGVAVSVTFNEANQVDGVRMALGAVAPVPLRVKSIEDYLVGKHLTEETAEECGRLAQEACSPISDLRASADYRREMVAVLTKRALLECVRQIGGGKAQ